MTRVEPLVFALDRATQNALAVYAPSAQTLKLISEMGRKIFTENLATSDTFRVESLKQLALCAVVEGYKGGSVDPIIGSEAINQMGLILDLNKPLLEVIDLVSNSFWRRVCEKKCADRLKFLFLNGNPNMEWKKLGVQTMLAELIESMEPESWNVELLEKLGPKVAPFVESLNIRRLTPTRLKLENPRKPEVRVINVPNEWCHHGSLARILSSLVNLTELSLVFASGTYSKAFKPYFLEMSFEDIFNLSQGLEKLTNLKTLRMSYNKLNELKLKTLTQALEKLTLRRLDLSFCHLDDMCGYPIALLLQTNDSLQELELEGNRLGKLAMQTIGFALETYTGPLVYLGLSKNIIGDDGILCLGGGVRDTENVQILDLSNCEFTLVGAMRITTFIGIHPPLQSLSITNVPFDRTTGCSLVENLELNNNIEELDCRSCGLTENQELKIRILLAKNRYYKKKLLSQRPQAVQQVVEKPPKEITPIMYDPCIESRILTIDQEPQDEQLMTPNILLALHMAQVEAEKKEAKLNRRVTFADP